MAGGLRVRSDRDRGHVVLRFVGNPIMRPIRIIRRLARLNPLAHLKARRHLAELDRFARHYERQAREFEVRIEWLRRRE